MTDHPGHEWDSAAPGRPVRVSPFADHMQMDLVERTDGRAVVECVVLPEHANTRGAAHGGVISSLIDMACGASVAYQPSIERKGAVTVALNVNYLHPAGQGDRLRAVGTRVGTGKRIVTSRAEVTNQAGVVLAVGVVTLRVLG